MADSKKQAKRIAKKGKELDYEAMALESLQRSWELDDKECMALALADANAWATLHLARVTRRAAKRVH
ncbi:MAG TPA: hypothetical protein VLE72_02825 [Candidatus Saccharimonadales bacterium]|nr:hypothetical protein [Candidatus Saccharimonadales bacterium]